MLFRERAGRVRSPAWLLLFAVVSLQAAAFAQPQKANAPGERVLHFPPDRCLGCLQIYSGPVAAPDGLPGQESEFSRSDWDYFCEAQGDVVVPANKLVGLRMCPKNLANVSHLRQLKPNDLHSLGIDCVISPPARFDQTVMPYLSGLTGLKELSLFGTNVTGSGLRHLGKMGSLRVLKIGMSDKSLDAGLPYLAKLKSLEHLYLDGRCTDAGLRALTEATELKRLFLNINEVQGPGLAHLEKLPALRSLTLYCTSSSTAGLACVKNLTSLTHLHLFNSRGDWPVTDADLAHLSGLTALKELEFTQLNQITDASVVHLKPLRSIKRLNLRGTRITDVGLAQLGESKSLESLQLSKGSDAGLAWLAESFKLKELSVGGEQITDEGVRSLAKLLSLEDLSLSSTSVTDAGMASIARLTNLQRLSLWGPSLRTRSARGHADDQLTDRGLTKLAPLKSLKSLFLRNAKITMSGLSRLNELPNLTLLNLGDVEPDDTVMDISGLTRLEQLTICPARDSRIRDEDLACLAGLKHLRNLQFVWPDRNTIGDQGVAYLAGLTNLDTLVIGSKVTDVGLGHLRDMKKLNLLSVHGDFTDEGLRHLEKLKSLAHLRLNPERPLGRAALTSLQQNLPHLYSFEVREKRADDKVDGKHQKKKKDEQARSHVAHDEGPIRPK